MKLLVSGSTGYIGTNLINRLLKSEHKVYAIVRPSTKVDTRINNYTYEGDNTKLINFMKNEAFDGVIHLASLFLAQHEPGDIEKIIHSNITFSTSLLDASTKANIPWFINTGTFWQHYKNKPYSPVNLYASTKQAFEDISRYYIETSSIKFVTIKLSDTFGPNDTRQKIFNLWSKIAKTKESLDMSPGEQIVDISYIDNVVDGYMEIIKLISSTKGNKLNGKSFAIYSDKRMSLKNLAKLFEKITNKKLRINWGKREYRPREVMLPWTKGAKIPKWKPKVSLYEGIRRSLK